MNGAREYSGLLKTEQVGRLYIVSGRHARGATLRIYVLPEGEAALENGPNNACLNSSAVEVYGVIGGQPGWTESYGWLHRGPWVEDFYALTKQRAHERDKQDQERAGAVKIAAEKEAQRVASLLAIYNSGAA